MGASNSHASVSVALERQQYHAGEELRGYVQVIVSTPMTCTELYANFIGEVRTRVHYQSTRTHTDGQGRTRTETETHTAHGLDDFVAERRLIASFPYGSVTPGLYQFPFVFALHPSLPSSCLVDGYDHAALTYRIEVHLHRPNIFKHDLVQRTHFDLVANVPHPISPAYITDHVQVYCCCCFARGHIVLSAALERNAFTASDAIAVYIQIQNASSVEVSSIDVSVVENTTFYAHGHHARKYGVLTRTALPSVHPGSGFGDWNCTQPMRVLLQMPPQFLHCTLSTRLLSVRHIVSVTAKTPFGVNNPSVSMPVTLHRSPFAAMASVPETLLQTGDADLPGAPPIPYAVDPHAMASPAAVAMSAGPPAAPSGVVADPAQALRGVAPAQQMMHPADGDAREMRAQLVG